MRAPTIRRNAERAAAARERKHWADVRKAVLAGPPTHHFELKPRQFSPWIETWQLKDQNRAYMWTWRGMSMRMYEEWQGDQTPKTYICVENADDCGNGGPGYPYRIRFENISQKPGVVSVFFFP